MSTNTVNWGPVIGPYDFLPPSLTPNEDPNALINDIDVDIDVDSPFNPPPTAPPNLPRAVVTASRCQRPTESP
jgi:hypothetical protein